MATLTVAAIIPTYNRADFLRDAIQSLLNQTRVPDEIIVIDDGSTDHTPDILARCGHPVKAIRRPNGGASAARNTGLQVTQSDLITFLDSDDTLPPNSIEKRACLLETHSEYGVVYSDALLVDLKGNQIALFTEFKPGPRPSGMVFPYFALDNLCPIHTFMFRYECVRQTGLFDETLDRMEDFDFWLRISAQYAFLYVDEALAYYRVHGNMITVDEPDRMKIGQIEVQKSATEMEAFHKLPPKLKARVYTSIGAKHAVLGQVPEARSWLTRAISTSHLFLLPYGLLLYTLLGSRGMQSAAHLRRQVRRVLYRNTRWGYNSTPT